MTPKEQILSHRYAALILGCALSRKAGEGTAHADLSRLDALRVEGHPQIARVECGEPARLVRQRTYKIVRALMMALGQI